MKLNNKGFTLIEILAVIVILCVLVGIAVPSVLSSINVGKEASYNIMISNVVTASGSLYEEVNYNGIVLYEYDNNGKTTSQLKIEGGSIYTNLQTLVSNGFLKGSNNGCTEDCDNQNKKVLLNPDTKIDIGKCNIRIYWYNNEYKVEKNDSDDDCPNEYKKEVK